MPIQCVHFDKTKWEPGYIRWKANQLRSLAAGLGTSMAPQRTEPTEPTYTTQTTLLGIGAGRPTPSQLGGGYEDPDGLLGVAQQQGGGRSIPHNRCHGRHRQLLEVPAAAAFSKVPDFNFDTGTLDIPIGRKLATATGRPVWECLRGSDSGYSGTSRTSSGSADLCHEQFEEITDLKNHYLECHAMYYEYKEPFLFKCRTCEWIGPPPPVAGYRCAQCGSVPVAWEKRYHGWVRQAAADRSPGSEQGTRPNGGGGPAGSSGESGGSGMRYFGGSSYGGSSGSGSGSGNNNNSTNNNNNNRKQGRKRGTGGDTEEAAGMCGYSEWEAGYSAGDHSKPVASAALRRVLSRCVADRLSLFLVVALLCQCLWVAVAHVERFYYPPSQRISRHASEQLRAIGVAV